MKNQPRFEGADIVTARTISGVELKKQGGERTERARVAYFESLRRLKPMVDRLAAQELPDPLTIGEIVEHAAKYLGEDPFFKARILVAFYNLEKTDIDEAEAEAREIAGVDPQILEEFLKKVDGLLKDKALLRAMCVEKIGRLRSRKKVSVEKRSDNQTASEELAALKEALHLKGIDPDELLGKK